MPSQRVHIVPHEQGWALKREGQSSVDSTYSTQKEAIDAGRDLARQDEVDLVVHRQDGTFRNVLTYTNEPMSDTTNNNDRDRSDRRVQAHDILSVGSRISWGAILAGAAIALAISAALGWGGLALGLTVHDRLGPRTLSIAGALWVLVSTLIALFCGGFAVSRITTGENKTEAALYGVTLWGVLFALAMLMANAGASTVAQLMNTRPMTDRSPVSADSTRAANMSRDDSDTAAAAAKAKEGASDIDDVSRAWWSFTSLALSMGAAVLGSVLGAGPGIVLLGRFGNRRQVGGAQVQPS